MSQQTRHLARMCADDDSDRVTGDCHRVRYDDMQRRPTCELDQLFGLTQASRGTGSKNQNVWSGGHGVTGGDSPPILYLLACFALSCDPWPSVRY